MEKRIIDIFVGLDLSFNSTGINTIIVDSKTKEQIEMDFSVLLFDKKYKHIRGVNQYTYKLPTNIRSEHLHINEIENDWYQKDQIDITLKYSIAQKFICNIINDIIDNTKSRFNVNKIILSIEGFIMPTLMGQIQFRSLTGLIMLQGNVRTNLLIKYKTQLKINIVSPTRLKKYFSGYGGAGKPEMIQAFKDHYDGDKLIDCSSIGKTNDLIDAFALNVNGIHKYYYYEHYNKLYPLPKPKSKNKRKTKKKIDINADINFKEWIP